MITKMRLTRYFEALIAPFKNVTRINEARDPARGRSSNRARSFRSWAKAAKLGNPEAEYTIAKCYIDGAGVPSNHREGLYWLQRSADQGYIEAELLMASMALNGLRLPDIMGNESRRHDGREDRFFPSEPDYEKAMHWAKLASAQGSAKADALVGYILVTGPEALRDVGAGRAAYRQSALAGCAEGQFGYGLLLLGSDDTVTGSHVNALEAEALFRKADQAGLPLAGVHLAALLEQPDHPNHNVKEAIKLYFKAADAGITAAQLRLGKAFMFGDCLPRDLKEAEKWLVLASQATQPEAAFLLGEIAVLHNASKPQYYLAARWYQKAAEAGHAAAARALGILYLNGNGVPRDEELARNWLAFAADQKDVHAQAQIGNSLLDGVEFGISPKQVANWFIAAAEDGDVAALYNTGLCYLYGLGTPMDEARAATWIERAATSLPEAQLLFAKLLLTGQGIDVDVYAARRYFQLASEHGLPEAKYFLAHMMLEGDGGERDRLSAKRMLEAAAEEGYSAALNTLVLWPNGEDDGEPPINQEVSAQTQQVP